MLIFVLVCHSILLKACNIIHKRQSNHNGYSSTTYLLASSKKHPVIQPCPATQTTLRQIIPGL